MMGSVNTWTEIIDGTSTGPVVPVVAEGRLVATLHVLWDDVDGLQVQVADDGGLDALSVSQAVALADALREVAGLQPPA